LAFAAPVADKPRRATHERSYLHESESDIINEVDEVGIHRQSDEAAKHRKEAFAEDNCKRKVW
jgi:hypothetical protein